MNQSLVELINQQNIQIERNINQLCYRDIVNYANDVGTEGGNLRDFPDLYNSPKDENAPTISLTKLIYYIMENYNCETPVEITNISCYNPDFSEQLSVDDSLFYYSRISNKSCRNQLQRISI